MKAAKPEPVPAGFVADAAAVAKMSAKRAAAIQSIIEQGHAQSVAHALFKFRAGEFSLPD